MTDTGPEQVTKDKLIQALRMVIADTEELLKATANQAGARIAEARVKLEESLTVAKARIAEAQEAALARTRSPQRLPTSTCGPVHGMPWALPQAPVGLVLGVLITRRSSRGIPAQPSEAIIPICLSILRPPQFATCSMLLDESAASTLQRDNVVDDVARA